MSEPRSSRTMRPPGWCTRRRPAATRSSPSTPRSSSPISCVSRRLAAPAVGHCVAATRRDTLAPTVTARRRRCSHSAGPRLRWPSPALPRRTHPTSTPGATAPAARRQQNLPATTSSPSADRHHAPPARAGTGRTSSFRTGRGARHRNPISSRSTRAGWLVLRPSPAYQTFEAARRPRDRRHWGGRKPTTVGHVVEGASGMSGRREHEQHEHSPRADRPGERPPSSASLAKAIR